MSTRIYYSKEAEKKAKQRQVFRTLSAVAVGITAGTAVALLFAPNEGEEVRALIGEALEEGFNRGREATNEALKQLEQEYPNLRDKVKSLAKDLA